MLTSLDISHNRLGEITALLLAGGLSKGLVGLWNGEEAGEEPLTLDSSAADAEQEGESPDWRPGKDTASAALLAEASDIAAALSERQPLAASSTPALKSLRIGHNPLGFEGAKALVTAVAVNPTCVYLGVEDCIAACVADPQRVSGC